jgi:TrkA domain protein
VHVERLALPGIGTRHVLRTATGRQVGVLRHRDGRRDLLLYDADDPDRAVSVPLTWQEAVALAKALTWLHRRAVGTPPSGHSVDF